MALTVGGCEFCPAQTTPATEIIRPSAVVPDLTPEMLSRIEAKLSALENAQTNQDLEAMNVKVNEALALVNAVANRNPANVPTNGIVVFSKSDCVKALFQFSGFSGAQVTAILGILFIWLRRIRNSETMKWVLSHEATKVQKTIAFLSGKPLETTQSLITLAAQLQPFLSKIPTIATPVATTGTAPLAPQPVQPATNP